MYPFGFLLDWDLIRPPRCDSWLVRRSSIKGLSIGSMMVFPVLFYRGNDSG